MTGSLATAPQPGGRPRHLLDFQDWTPERLEGVLEGADTMLQVLDRPVKKVPALQGLTVCNAFSRTAPAPARASSWPPGA